ncbi:hypothetical protein F5141DRAFT_1006319 [Pisolithus sp. B1]|nr:hypothetical protein F5141DRAFT_1006319 [Pisolithus sp. B1]KAI6113688.1 hypothetical protein EV401DRAFT_1866699 [Pisolithus croceorrhizus]
MLSVLSLFAVCAQVALSRSVPYNGPQTAFVSDVKVPVVLGVMSRCPDALLCESVWDRVLQRVGDKVDISLSFIAKPNASDEIYGVTCLHGMEECAGNVHELCVAKYHPTPEWWSFLHCENFQGRAQVGLPDTAVKCAEVAGFQWENDRARECAGDNGQGHEGVRLLQESVKTSMQLGIKTSCTILINGRQVCIHDGTWYECEGGHTPADFIRQINEEYERLNDVD